VLADYEGPLEPLGTLAEADRWLEELAAEGRIGADSAARLRDDAAEARRGSRRGGCRCKRFTAMPVWTT
jgi:hypothetical protein